MTKEPTQSDKFKEAARELDADENEKRWTKRLRKVAKLELEKPAPQRATAHRAPPASPSQYRACRRGNEIAHRAQPPSQKA